ncbi:MAG: carbohydrate-binding family 9-like protein [Bacteroidetes bacterium]|nr:carbohydrate-binding family 9-like protein [Bacteroidota bacterium]MCL5737088.1 carbohydrate-binding family 9-like protein [Bacteroidota bacterium]
MIVVILTLVVMSLGLVRVEVNVPENRLVKPVYECRRTDGRINIDGILIERSWRFAKEVNLILTDSGAPPLFGTKTKLMWDDNYLYISFQCADNGIYAKRTKKNDAFWQEEAVEVFLDFEGEGKRYVEIEVNPLNAVFDKFMNGIRKPLPENLWDSGVRTTVHLENESINGNSVVGWIVELAFPFEAIRGVGNMPPKSGDAWRINLYRVKHNPVEEFSAWSPTDSIDFHQPDKFGVLIFSDKEVTEEE